jgi:transposase
MGTKERAFAPLPPVCLEDLVPPDHFYRHLQRSVDLRFVRELVRDAYAERGRPSIDPVVFFKLQFILFFEGLRSERQLMRVVADRLSLRWYVGFDLDERPPDQSSLTRIRERYGLAIFERFFERVVEMCREAGLIWGKESYFDATKVRANAALDGTVPRFYWKAKQHLGELFTEGASPEGGDDPGPDGVAAPAPVDSGAHAVRAPAALPTRLPPEDESRLAEENRSTWKLLEERRLHPERPPHGG